MLAIISQLVLACHELQGAQQDQGVVGCRGEQAQQLGGGAAAGARPAAVQALQPVEGGEWHGCEHACLLYKRASCRPGPCNSWSKSCWQDGGAC